MRITGPFTGIVFSSLCALAVPAGVHAAGTDGPAGNIITSIGGTFSGVDIAPIIGANRFYTNGYTGSNTVTYNVEAGLIWNGHETLTHVTTVNNSASGALNEFDRHATWVGSFIGGRQAGAFAGTYQSGVAPQTTLRSSGIATSWSGTRYATGFSFSNASIFNPYQTAFTNGDVINSSWGSTGSTNTAAGTDLYAITIDGLARSNPTATFVVSAGNSGPSSNTVGSPGSGYNGITVGALQNNGANQYTTVASFSSRGGQTYKDPVNGTFNSNVRAPVDIVAPGTDLTAAYYGGETGGNRVALGGTASGPTSANNLYQGSLAGTSFSSPIVAGGVALMKNAAKARSLPATALDTRVVKAALLNAADKTSGWSNGQTTTNNIVTTSQSLDFAAGAGAMNLNKTYDQYLLGQTDITGTTGGTSTQALGWDLASVSTSGQTDVSLTTPFRAGTTFNATLDWFRDRTSVDANNALDSAFADLDLEIWNATFTTKYAESISPFNEVEHLSFALPTDTTIGLRVLHTGYWFNTDASTSETYGLAWSGTAVPEPASLTLIALGATTLLRRRRRA